MGEQETKKIVIERRLQEFCDRFLSDEALLRLVALREATEACDELNLTRGDPDIWAAALAYAFARMNFLLDGDGPANMHLDRSEFFDFFAGASRSTVTQKATRIEKALDFYYGHPDYCLPAVADAMPKCVELPNGLIVPENFLIGESADGREIELGFLDEAASRKLEEQLRERERAVEEEERRRTYEEKMRKKREEERKTQPDLLDFGD